VLAGLESFVDADRLEFGDRGVRTTFDCSWFITVFTVTFGCCWACGSSVECVLCLMLDFSFELTVLNAFFTKLRPPLKFAQLLVELLIDILGEFEVGTEPYLDIFVLIAPFWLVLIIIFFCVK